jgi:1-acyl-sn-glycerol-3-phosphate acyltransferase
LPLGLSREKFMTRIETVICEATNRLVAAEQAELFARAPVSVKA